MGPRLSLRIAQKQILTPGLVQMVTVLQLNRLELKEMITQEIVKNPVLEEAGEDPGEAVTPEELLPLLEAETSHNPADKQLLDASMLMGANTPDGVADGAAINGNLFPDAEESASAAAVTEGESAGAINDPLLEQPVANDPFDEIDFGSFFDEYLDPGYKSPASESVEKPSFETFLSAPVTLGDYLRQQLSVSIIREKKEQTLTLALPERNQSEVLDESFETPEIDAETAIDVSEAQSEVARIMPELEQMVVEIKPDLEEATREIRNHQQELKREMRELQRELRDEEIQMQKNHIQKNKTRVVWHSQADI